MRPDVHEVTLHGFTHGAEAVGRLPSGKVCFVAHAIPGERVLVAVTDERSKWARARLVEVLEASPDRVEPPCPYAGAETPGGPARCGGCALQHVAPARQADLKRQIVVEQLERIGRFRDPPVDDTVVVAALAYRSQARFAVTPAGALGFHRVRCSEVVPIDRCLLLDERTQALRAAAGDGWRGVEEVTVRAGARGRALVVRPGAEGLPALPDGDMAVALVGTGRPVDLRGVARVEERVAGFSFQVSPTSFFQPGPAGAEALVGLVRAFAAVRTGERVLDGYAGVGLFARVLAADGGEVTAVESHRGAVDDAQVNLDGVADVVKAEMGRFARRSARAGRRFDVVVIDPPREGAGPAVCHDLAAITGRVLVYVSCDPAALARDARALADAGLRLDRATPVDQFAQTAAVESVACFLTGA